MQIMAINSNHFNVITVNDGINANNSINENPLQFDFFSNPNIIFHMQSACRGITLNPATVIL